MKKIISYTLVAILFLGITGCASKHISKDSAKEKALKEYNGEIVSYDQDLDDDTPYYEFDIVQGNECYEIKVHSKTGEIISKKLNTEYSNGATDNNNTTPNSNNKTNGNTNNTQTTTPTVTMEEAKTIALNKVGGGTVIKCELDYSDDYPSQGSQNIQVYEVDIHYNNKEYDVVIHADTKEILKYEEDFID